MALVGVARPNGIGGRIGSLSEVASGSCDTKNCMRANGHHPMLEVDAETVRLRERISSLEAQLAHYSKGDASTSHPQNIGIEDLQSALAEKQKSLQQLRLRSEFASAHELHIEAKQALVRCVSTQRTLSARAPAALHALKPLSSQINALHEACTKAQSKVDDFDERCGQSWLAMEESSALQDALPRSLGKLMSSLEPALALAEATADGVGADTSAADERKQSKELQQRKASLQAEIKELQGGRAPIDPGRDAAVAKLEEEAAKLREEVARRTQAVSALRQRQLSGAAAR